MEDREFQNLLAIRNQLVMLLIATAGGVIWLAQEPFVYANCLFIIIGAFLYPEQLFQYIKLIRK